MALTLPIEPAANELLNDSPLALLIGMLLDQQIAMEHAFTGPYTIAQRMGGELDAHRIAATDPDEFAQVLQQKPAVHRYPASMAERVQKLCQYLVDQYDGDAARVWQGVTTGKELLGRLQALPGYGKQKAQIFVALLGKRRDVQPDGWREAAGNYGDEGSHRSIADITDAESLGQVRSFKQEMKRQAKAARG